MRDKKGNISAQSIEKLRLNIPLVGSFEFNEWKKSLTTRLGRVLTRDDIKFLAKLSHNRHADRLKKGKLVQPNLLYRALPASRRRR